MFAVLLKNPPLVLFANHIYCSCLYGNWKTYLRTSIRYWYYHTSLFLWYFGAYVFWLKIKKCRKFCSHEGFFEYLINRHSHLESVILKRDVLFAQKGSTFFRFMNDYKQWWGSVVKLLPMSFCMIIKTKILFLYKLYDKLILNLIFHCKLNSWCF